MNIVIIRILIVLLILQILHFIYYSIDYKIIEGNTSYQEYPEDDNSAMALSVQNEGNINFLKDQLTQIQTIKTQIIDLSNNVYINTQSIQSIGDQVNDTSTQLLGDSDDDANADDATADDANADDANADDANADDANADDVSDMYDSLN